MRGLYGIYKSRDTRAKPEWQVFMNRVQTERLVHNYFIARKYCVLSRYVANNYINVFPANTFFNDAYQTISDILFIATGRVARVTGYKYIYIYIRDSQLNRPESVSLASLARQLTVANCEPNNAKRCGAHATRRDVLCELALRLE